MYSERLARQLEKKVFLLENEILMHKETLEKLKESEDKFRLAFENANTGICLVDLQGNMVKVNQKMSDIFGYTKEELENMNLNDITHKDYIEVGSDFINKAINGEMEKNIFEKCYVHKKGSLVYAVVSISLVRNSNRKPLYFICHIHDITERKKSEKQLDENLEYFAHLIDHIRNPLAIISGFVQVNVGDEKTKDVVIRQVARIEKLLRELDQGWMDTEETRKFLKNYI